MNLQRHVLTNQALPASGVKVATEAQEFTLGTVLKLNDGRVFRYAKAGAVALAAGKLTQGVAPTAHHVNIATGVAVAVGATEFTVDTTLSTATTKNEYEEGILLINDEDGEGHSYAIKSNTASTKPTIVLQEPIVKALAATSEFTLIRNPFRGSIIAPTTLTGLLNGVPVCDVGAAEYYWSQVRGLTAALTHGTVVIGNAVMAGGAAGAVTPLGNDDTQLKQIGIVQVVRAATEYSLIQLLLE